MTSTTDTVTAPGMRGDHPEGTWRASDADREHVAQTLHQAVALGMLTMGEAEERLTAVYAARFRHELSPITADLPIGQPATARTRSAQMLSRMLQFLTHLLAITAPMRATARAVIARHRVLAVIVALIGIALCAAAVFVGAFDLLPD